MTMAEKKLISIEKEIEKLQKSIERNEGRLQKKMIPCEKLGCAWSEEEWFEHRRENTFTNEQWSAWFEMDLVRNEIKDLNRRLENAQKRLSKQACEVEGIRAEEEETEKISKKEAEWLEWLSLSQEERKARYEAWLKKFKADCLEDGVIINTADAIEVSGLTKSGKKFFLYINNGFTERSFHCYTLTIEGRTIFTSGNFETAYRIIKR